MNAMHIRVHDADSTNIALVEATLRSIDGVIQVASIEDIGLASVLYDERRATESGIVRTVRQVGIGVDPVLRDRWP